MTQRPYITFNGHNSSEFGLIVTDIQRPTPKKRIMRLKLPFSNADIDFSQVAGQYTYDRRELIYTFVCKTSSEQAMIELISELAAWLLGAPSGVLSESLDPDHYYFDATCDALDPKYISPTVAELKAHFTAYPFRRSTTAQSFTYSLTPTSTQYTLTLAGTKALRPLFAAEESMYFLFGGYQYLIPDGAQRYQLTRAMLLPGENTFNAWARSQSETITIDCIDEVI